MRNKENDKKKKGCNEMEEKKQIKNKLIIITQKI